MCFSANGSRHSGRRRRRRARRHRDARALDERRHARGTRRERGRDRRALKETLHDIDVDCCIRSHAGGARSARHRARASSPRGWRHRGRHREKIYDGAALSVARHGRVALRVERGFAERASARRLAPSDVFVSMSIGKQFMVAASSEPHRARRPSPDDAGGRADSRVRPARQRAHHARASPDAHERLPMMLPPMPPSLRSTSKRSCSDGGAAARASRGLARLVLHLVAHAVLAECVRRADGCRGRTARSSPKISSARSA